MIYKHMNRYSYERTVRGMLDKYDIECCDQEQVHTEALLCVKGHMPPEEELLDMAELFKVFGDTTRIKILYALFESELCVCDIAALLTMSQSAISHQLRVIKQAKLVTSRRDGKTIFYSLADEHVKTIIGMAKEHLEE